jgi:hypothetical protein
MTQHAAVIYYKVTVPPDKILRCSIVAGAAQGNIFLNKQCGKFRLVRCMASQAAGLHRRMDDRPGILSRFMTCHAGFIQRRLEQLGIRGVVGVVAAFAVTVARRFMTNRPRLFKPGFYPRVATVAQPGCILAHQQGSQNAMGQVALDTLVVLHRRMHNPLQKLLGQFRMAIKTVLSFLTLRLRFACRDTASQQEEKPQ